MKRLLAIACLAVVAATGACTADRSDFAAVPLAPYGVNAGDTLSVLAGKMCPLDVAPVADWVQWLKDRNGIADTRGLQAGSMIQMCSPTT